MPLEISFSKWADHDKSDWNVIPRCLWYKDVDWLAFQEDRA